MAIDYSVFNIPKSRPRALDKDDRKKRKQSIDEKENAKVKARSGGQCEVYSVTQLQRGPAFRRCLRRASEVHHLLGGMGRRGVRESAQARNKLHVCGPCHDLITRHILQASWKDVNDRAGTITFVRLK